MRLTKARFQNFRNIADAILEIGDGRFIVIRGDNHAGKSSIREGISMNITPSTKSLDELGRGFAAKIKHGQPKSILTTWIQGAEHLIENMVTLNRNQTGRTSKAICLDDQDWHPLPFENFLEANRAALGVCLNIDKFLSSMDEEKQKALLASLVLPSYYEFDKEK